jgi:hypothetical protein
MTTSGSTDFNLEFVDIAEEAFERAGREMRSGYDLRTARRSMNLLTIEWANRGINMWTIEQGTTNLVQGTATYDLPDDTIDLLEHVIRTGAGNASTQADLTLTRISVSTYATIPNKLAQARPIQIYISRNSGATYPATSSYSPSEQANPQFTVWPVPDQGTALSPYYQVVYWRMRRIQNAGDGIQTPDMPFRFLPCITAGLAYYIAQKIPEGTDRIQMLKAAYEEQWNFAAGEDREKAAVRFVPRRMYLGNTGSF